jgi:hypothetical protein
MTNIDSGCYNPTLQYANPLYNALNGQTQGIIPNMLKTFGVQGGLSGLLNGVGQGLGNLGQSIQNGVRGELGGSEGNPDSNATQPLKEAATPSESNPLAGVFSGLFGS